LVERQFAFGFTDIFIKEQSLDLCYKIAPSPRCNTKSFQGKQSDANL